MKFATIDGNKVEATPGANGKCPGCEAEVIARCGEVRVWYWAHKANRHCDRWWEPETPWHRAWKGHFPVKWQEVRQQAEDGEWHIADVKTDRGRVIEFQNSHLKPDERLSRNAFYRDLVWVVNGARLQRDQAQFFEALGVLGSMETSPLVRRICMVRPNKSGLLRDWAGSTAPVFFDFGQEPTLWCLLPNGSGERQYVIEFSRMRFIQLHQKVETQADPFADIMKNLCQVAGEYSAALDTQARNEANRQPQLNAIRHPGSVQRYLSRQERYRRRF